MHQRGTSLMTEYRVSEPRFFFAIQVFISKNLFLFSKYLMWHRHILIPSPHHSHTIMSLCDWGAKHADVFVFVADPICGSSTTPQHNNGAFVCNNKNKKACTFCRETSLEKPCAILEVMACFVFGGGMRVKVIRALRVFFKGELK